MLESPARSTDDRLNRLYKPATFILIALYLASCFAPLRLEVDSLRYFAIENCLETRCATNSALPYGYPVLLFSLSKLGLLKSFFIAVINAIYLLCSLFLIKKMIGPTTHPFLFFMVVLLHWTCIKLSAYPLSEMQYLFFSTASLYCFFRYTQNKKRMVLLQSFALAALAVLTRSIGIALIAALIAGFVWENRKMLSNKKNRNIAWVVTACLFAVTFFSIIKIPAFHHYMISLLRHGALDPGIIDKILGHLKECGQLLLNMPIGKVESFLPIVVVNIIFALAGILLFNWFVYALYLKRKIIPPAIIIYLIFYSIIIFSWPFYDPRFWLPILPFIVVIVLQTPVNKIYFSKVIVPLLFFIYIMTGSFAIGYSLYTTFNKKIFARSQAKGIFRNEYETHFFGKPLSDTATHIDANVLHLLEKYDKRSKEVDR